jgi:hypothetical protein
LITRVLPDAGGTGDQQDTAMTGARLIWPLAEHGQ